MLKNRYRISTLVGAGGFGNVYLAADIQLDNRKVALKEMSQSGLRPQDLPQAVQAFKNEAKLLGGLHHPNLPGIIEYFEENNYWYLVMSFIEGETLEEYLDKQPDKKLPLKEVVNIGKQLSSVLGYLHQQKPPIIFRDLKPANIMRTASGQIYLIDFGIARNFKPGQTKDTIAVGSQGYAPPEQYGSTQTTPRSDIYSLGVVLHQLLSGHDPITTPFTMPPLPTNVPAPLAIYITQMLALDAKNRPADILAVQQKLQDALSPHVNQPPPLPPPPPPQKSPFPLGTLRQTYTGHTSYSTTYASSQLASQSGTLPPGAFQLAWSPDGKQIASLFQGRMLVWRTDGQEQSFVYKGHSAPVQDVAWSPDKKSIASASEDGTVQVWDASGKKSPYVYSGHQAGVRAIAWSPDSQFIASASQDGKVLIWQAHSGGQTRLAFQGQISPIQTVAWSPDGAKIAFAAQNGAVQVCQADGHAIFTYKGHVTSAFLRAIGIADKPNLVSSLAWDSSSQRLASASHDGRVHVWNFNDGGQPLVYQGHVVPASPGEIQRPNPVSSVTWSPDGAFIASAALDGKIQVWLATNGSLLRTYESYSLIRESGSYSPSHTHVGLPVHKVAWSPDGKRLATGAYDGSVLVWYVDYRLPYGQTTSGLSDHQQPYVYREHALSGGNAASVRSVSWSPDSTCLVSASLDGTVLMKPVPLFVHRKPVGGGITTLAWSPDRQQRLASATQHGSVLVESSNNQGIPPTIHQHHQQGIVSLSWSWNGQQIFSVAKDGTVLGGNADGSGKASTYQSHTSSAVVFVVWSPDRTRIAAVGQDGTIEIRSAGNGSGPLYTYQGTTKPVVSLAWSPDSSRIVSAYKAREDAIHVWSVDGIGSPFLYQGHNFFSSEVWVTSVSWSPDGRRIASSTSGKEDAPNASSRVVHIWDVQGNGQPLFVYTGHSTAVLAAAWSPDGAHIASASADGSVLVWSS